MGYKTITLAITVRIFVGAFTAVVIKNVYKTSSVGLDGEESKFRRPIFVVLCVNIALVMLGLVDGVYRRLRTWYEDASVSEMIHCSSLVDSDSEGDDAPPLRVPSMHPKAPYLKKALFAGIPATFDVVTNILTNYSLLFIPASVSFMIKVAGIIFTTWIYRLVFHQHQTSVQWLGIGFCCLGLTFGGAADLMDGNVGESGLASNVWGLALALLGQLVGAMQAVAEECLVKEFRLSPTQTLGWEGFWGTIALLVLHPFIRMLEPGQRGFRDSIEMLINSPALRAKLLTFLILATTTVLASLQITKLLSSVHRKLLNPAGGIVVWACSLLAYYVLHTTAMDAEPWQKASYYQAAGYLLILLGLATHGGLIPPPWELLGSRGSDEGLCGDMGATKSQASEFAEDNDSDCETGTPLSDAPWASGLDLTEGSRSPRAQEPLLPEVPLLSKQQMDFLRSLERLTVGELQSLAASRGISALGPKHDLAVRLARALLAA